MPSEITHKANFSIGKYLGWLVAAFIAGYVLGLNHSASANQKPPIPEPSRTVQVTPTR
jgi:hypothetical protein